MQSWQSYFKKKVVNYNQQFTTFLSLKPFRNDVSYVKSGAFLSGGSYGSAYQNSVALTTGFS